MAEARRRNGPTTTALPAASPPRRHGAPVSGEIRQSSTFVVGHLDEGELLLRRYGTNPNHARIEAKVPALEVSQVRLVASSGMGAMSAALLACVRSGDQVGAAQVDDLRQALDVCRTGAAPPVDIHSPPFPPPSDVWPP